LLLLQNNKHKYDNYHKNNKIYNFDTKRTAKMASTD